MRPDVILIDDGGVMNDNDLRGHQWKELCGQFFAPRLGGDPAAWAEANFAVFDRLFADAGLAPSQALVVDDSAQAVPWARPVGARALQVGVDLASLADLPRALGVGCRGSGA